MATGFQTQDKKKMEDINRIELEGTVGYVNVLDVGGKIVAYLSLQTNKALKSNDGTVMIDTTWHSVVVCRGKNTPDTASIRKGDRLHVTGRVRRPLGRHRREGHLTHRPRVPSRTRPTRSSSLAMTASATFRFRHRTRAARVLSRLIGYLFIMWLDSDGQRRTLARGTSRRPE